MTDTYILNTNDNARARLDLQHELYAESSTDLLRLAGLSTGMKGLEIGCGSGAMTVEIAKLIGSQGDLLSIDLSEDQINYAQKITSDYPSIRFKQCDVNELTSLEEQFDFIYCRMVLHHLADAKYAILQMQKCLKPGGVVICEEPSIFDSTFCYPPSLAYETFVEFVRACFRENKRDFEIAHRLGQEFTDCNFEILHHSLFQPLLTSSDEKKIYAMALTDIRPQVIELALADSHKIDDLYNKLIKLANSDATMTWIRMHRVIAKKRV